MPQLLIKCRGCGEVLVAAPGQMGVALGDAGWVMSCGETLCPRCKTNPDQAHTAVAGASAVAVTAVPHAGFAPVGTGPIEPRPAAPSLMGSRLAALLIDGLVLLPVVGVVIVALWQLFPHSGFVTTASGTNQSGSNSSASLTAWLGPPGILMMTALSLSYFLILEARSGQTYGKRKMGLRVVSQTGGLASANAIAARTLLRLIDGLGFYLVGFLVALFSGPRRRRLGDLAAGTTVVRDIDIAPPATVRPARAATLYPIAWIATVLILTFGLGLGAAVDRGQRAVDLLHAYVRARAAGDAPLACSLLSRDQQRELVARLTSDYVNARASLCPHWVLTTSSAASLVNPELANPGSASFTTRRGPMGSVVLQSASYRDLSLVAVQENGRMVLDSRGLQKTSFISQCTVSGHYGPTGCFCIYEWLRAQHINPYGDNDYQPDPLTIQQALGTARTRCATNPSDLPS